MSAPTTARHRGGPGARGLAGRHRRPAASVMALALIAVAALPARVQASPLARRTPVAPAVTLGTPVLSVRRVPTFVAASVAAQHLDTSLTSILANPGIHVRGANTCLLVRQDGRTLFAQDPTEELLPASNLKLFTATAALDKLGAQSRFTTPVDADHAPVAGVVSGNLYLVGAGDPILRTPAFVASLQYPEATYTSLDQLAAQVRAAGVTSVTGSVVADESLFDTQRTVATWKPSYLAQGVVGPLSAVDVNDGYASFAGGVDVGAPQPATQAAATFTQALQAAGVHVSGPPTTGVTPAGSAHITSISSAPLVDVLGAVLRTSDDTGAELITKQLGKRFGGGGTTAAGVAVIRADLTADGLPVSQLAAVDGSGLDRSDRATCTLVTDTLARSGATGALASMLPVAGRSGTLIHRMVNTAAAGRVLAKTGTLDDVSALSGFVLPAKAAPAPAGPALSRSPLVFSLIENGIAAYSTGETVGDQIGEALAGYPNGPAPASLDPLPVQTAAVAPSPVGRS